jgi:sigma-E factor negative regulatory protein RseA
MSNEELDSQLSAMFDDELPAPECELLARRLARDEMLKARWGRYALIGAALRSERVSLSGAFAQRVSAAIANEPALLANAAMATATRRARFDVRRWSQPVLGTGVAAAVAATAILWLRAEAPAPSMHAFSAPSQSPALLASNGGAQGSAVSAAAQAAAPLQTAASAGGASRDQDGRASYTVPTAIERNGGYTPPAELANFVVAHSQFSAPFLRRNLLSSLVTAEGGASTAQPTLRNADQHSPGGVRTPNADAPR